MLLCALIQTLSFVENKKLSQEDSIRAGIYRSLKHTTREEGQQENHFLELANFKQTQIKVQDNTLIFNTKNLY